MALEQEVIASSSLFEADSSIRKLLAELKDVRDTTNSIQNENIEEFKSSYSDMAMVLDYVIYLHVSFFLICSEKFFSSKVPHTDQPLDVTVSQKMSYVTLMITHLINSLYSIRLLSERGLDVQAKQILRSYIEYSDISIAVLGQSDFYENYKRMGESEEIDKNIWHKYTRPAALTKILRKIYANFAEEGVDIWEIIQGIRSPVYSHLSDYTHGHFMAVYTSAFVEGEGSALLGRVNKNTRSTMLNAIVYSYSFLKHSMVMIVQHQHIPFTHFGDEGIAYIKYYKILERFFPKFALKHGDIVT